MCTQLSVLRSMLPIRLGSSLSCNNQDALFCRTDLQSSASSYLTTCINSQCTTNSIDLSDALSLYNGHCGFNGASLNNFGISSGTSVVASATTTQDNTLQTSSSIPAAASSSATLMDAPTVTQLDHSDSCIIYSCHNFR